MKRVREATKARDSWPEQVHAGLGALLRYLAEEPALVRTCVVEALAAGPAAVAYYEESQQALASLLRLGRDVSPHGSRLPEALEEAVVGGLFWIVYQRLTAASPAVLPGLLPELTEFALTPYLGTGAAREIAAVQERGAA